jgi:hypothetical protein
MTMSLLSTVLSFYVFGFNPVRDNGLVVWDGENKV